MTIASWVDDALFALPQTSAEERRRAARLVASTATSPTDAAQLLDVLGLTAQDGLGPAQDNSERVLAQPA